MSAIKATMQPFQSVARHATKMVGSPYVRAEIPKYASAAMVVPTAQSAVSHTQPKSNTFNTSNPLSKVKRDLTVSTGMTSPTQVRFYTTPSKGTSKKQSYYNTISIPDRSQYKRESSEPTRRAFTYFMAGTGGALAAMSVKNVVVEFLSTMSASADVLALAKVEVDLSDLPEGKNLVLKWRGKPIFIRHRTADEIAEANSVDVSTLRDPETDKERAEQQEWLVMIGVCTHLGCVPVGEAGDYGGWFCPCHGSHYDISGRIRKGPAPLNLAVPPYTFAEDTRIVIG
eukprot:Clim_evm67s225 gene=Clim_evmTU67s225